MAIRTYGRLEYCPVSNKLQITQAEPHVSIKLKSIFPKIAKTSIPPYSFEHTPEVCNELLWFMDRYPLTVSKAELKLLTTGKKQYINTINELEAIHLPTYQPPIINNLKGGFAARPYQVTGQQTYLKCKRLLLGDDLGLGKTLTSILSFLVPGTLPAAVVVQTHMPNQWKVDQINKFTDLQVHIIKGTKPYNLPPADVYIFKYSCLSGWVNVFDQHLFKSVIFDEVQEMRRSESEKYSAAKVLSNSVGYCLGLSATPVYNYGDEIYNVLDLINPGCLGDRWDFLREWAVPHGQRHHKIVDPKALGTYLRENFLMLRRTRAEVGRELPPVNKIIQTVGYDDSHLKKTEELARRLATTVLKGRWEERGQAAMELDMLARQATGVSKAREVAAYVRILLENNEPVVLAGWHREVYDIWLEELKDFEPVMYTGTESGRQKEEAKAKFMRGETNLFIISLRSGAGLDGLQQRCRTVVIGELDWSPQVHNQLIGRVDRDGQDDQVTAIFCVSDAGSDPAIISVLGLKASQAHGIVDPLADIQTQHSSETRMKVLAQQYLNRKQAA